MRILLAHNNYVVHGGAEVFVHEVARVLQSHGHAVAFFASYEPGCDSEWAKYFPKSPDYRRGKLNAMLQFPRLVYSSESRRSVRAMIREFKPDIVHCFAIYTKLTPSILDEFRSADIPVVCSMNDYKHICPNYKLYHHGHVCEACKGKRFFHAIVNKCAHNSVVFSAASAIESYAHRFLDIYKKNIDTFLFASEFMARKTEQFWGAGTFKWQLLRNPFDATSYSMTREPGTYALYFGRLIEEKGVDVLVRAAELCSKVPILIVGDGPDREKLEALSRSKKLANVQFVGEKWGRDMDEILRRCRYVVVPSLWHENFPYVILQALAMGKPVIGSNRGGIPELVVHGESGYIYEANDVEQLAIHMQSLSASDDDVVRLGSSAKDYANRNFNDREFYSNLERIYSEALA